MRLWSWSGRTNGESRERQAPSAKGIDAATLELTGLQEELIRAVAETGTPTVVVLVNGRPLATRYVAEHIPAVVEAWVDGEQGGRAVAEVLFGDVNPSGRLPVTVPRHAGQLPVYYNFMKSKDYWLKNAWGHPYTDLDPKPLYPFGHGLSYTTFEYANLRLSAAHIGPGESVEVSLDVRNTGDRAGRETVQLYIQDVISTVSTPVMELKGFDKIGLEPGETKTVKLVLMPEDLALLDRHLERVVEPGEFRVLVGSSSAEIRLRGSFVVAEP